MFSQSFDGALFRQQGIQVRRQVRVFDCALEQNKLSSTSTINPLACSSLKVRIAIKREHGISRSA
jgi:hypothetical protein